MADTISYTEAAMERSMKNNKRSDSASDREEDHRGWQAAETIGISNRQMLRWRERYEQSGIQLATNTARMWPSTRLEAQSLPGMELSLLDRFRAAEVRGRRRSKCRRGPAS